MSKRQKALYYYNIIAVCCLLSRTRTTRYFTTVATVRAFQQRPVTWTRKSYTSSYIPSSTCDRARTVQSQQPRQRQRCQIVKRYMSLEVEQKFLITKKADNDDDDGNGNDGSLSIEETLQGLGFVSKGTKTIIDWYFDTPDNYLTTKDYWLRFRDIQGKDGNWELKRGKRIEGKGKDEDGQDSSDTTAATAATTTTVYEEIEGEEAIKIAISLLPESFVVQSKVKGPVTNDDNSAAVDDIFLKDFIDDVPKFPTTLSLNGSTSSAAASSLSLLIPFCRLVTTRSSWIYADPNNGENNNKNNNDDEATSFVGLQVDLDTTNTGHAVGEVETMASSEDINDILLAKEKVQTLIDIIKRETSQQDKGDDDDDDDTNNTGRVEGKLGHYLMTYRPDHYNACIASGVF